MEVYDINQIPEPEDMKQVVETLMVNPNLSLLNYFNDFTDAPDPENQNDDFEDSGAFPVPGQGLMSLSSHALHKSLHIDPSTAMQILIAKATRKAICYGATPLSVSAMLYHIDVNDPNGSFIASEASRGLYEAAKAFDIQVSSRKIRFDATGNHLPQDATGFISILSQMGTSCKRPTICMTPHFKQKGNNLVVVGRVSDDIASSDYLSFYHKIEESPLAEFDLEFESKIQSSVKEVIDRGLVSSANPIGRGGVFFTLMRAGAKQGLGFDITTPSETRMDSFLFGESMGRILLGVDEDNEEELYDYFLDNKIPFFTLGHITKGEIRIDDESFGYVNKTYQNK